MRRVIAATLLVLAGVLFAKAPAQQPLRFTRSEQLSFRHLDILDGLSQNTVSCMMQDRQGYIWLGTKDGVNIYDGNDFHEPFTADGTHCSYVHAFFEDEEGIVWIGSEVGLWRFDPVAEELLPLSKVTQGETTITHPVCQIQSDAAGILWLCVDEEGIYRFDPKGKTLELVYDSHRLGRSILCMAFGTNRIWVGTFGGGLFYSDDELKSLQPYTCPDGRNPMPDCSVSRLALQHGLLYVATEQMGLSAITPRTMEYREVFGHDEEGRRPFVRDMMFHDDDIWICTENGLYVLNITTRQVQHYVHQGQDAYSLSDNALYCILTDRDGGIWIGSYFGGVNYLDTSDRVFEKFYAGRDGSDWHGLRVREICEDAHGRIWIGTEDQGLNTLDPSTGKVTYVEASSRFRNIHGLCCIGDELWVGTFSNGLHILDINTCRELRSYDCYDGSGLPSNNIFSIIRTRQGETFLGTMSGVAEYDVRSKRFVTTPGLEGTFVYNLFEDRDGALWAATYSSGLFVRKAGELNWTQYLHHADQARSIPSNMVYGTMQDSRGTHWIFTQQGLCRFDARTETFIADSLYTVALPKGVVYQLVEDTHGTYWITTNGGLYSINPSTAEINRYTTSDGLLSNQFNYCSSLITDDGIIYAGTIEGMIRFNPNQLANTRPLPKPVVANVWVFNHRLSPQDDPAILDRSISFLDRIELASDENSLTIGVVIPSFNATETQQLKYLLEGFDTEWRYLQTRRERISYAKLPPGDYTLRLTAFDRNDERAGNEAKFQIVIRPPFYQTVWAWCIYFLLLVGLLSACIYIYHARSRKRMLQQMLAFRHNKERELNRAKIDFFTNVAHEIRTPLTLIKAPLDVLLSQKQKFETAMREDLEVMSLNVNRLLLLVNQLLDFRKMQESRVELRRRHVNISLLVEELRKRFAPTIEAAGRTLQVAMPGDTPVMAYVDQEAITKILSNLLTNAIKYGKSYVKLQLTCDQEVFRINVSNDGELIPKSDREAIFNLFNRSSTSHSQPGTGIGLSYARQLAELHDGTLDIVDSETENIFSLAIPRRLDEEPQLVSQQAENVGSEELTSLLPSSQREVVLLIVDDNAELLSFMKKRLSAIRNYRVLTAEDGLKALKLIDGEYIDIVISDLMMPNMDGLELCSRIKGDVHYCHLPVVLLTAKTEVEDKIKGLEMGADAYVEKPFNFDYLLATIGSLMRNRQQIYNRFTNNPVVPPTSAQGIISKMDEKFLIKLDTLIQANFHNPDFNMDSIIESMGLSRSAFYRKIKGLSDLSPNEYIRMLRLRKAAQLLSEGELSVSEICYQVGFGTPSYFSKCFQKQFGVLPKEYGIEGKKKGR